MSFYTDFPVYPTAVLSTTDYPDQLDNVDDVLADLVNALRDEMIAVQAELGTVPKAGYADVKTRLNYYTNWQNYTQSAGRLSGGAVTDGGGGTADIAAGSGYFKTTDSETGVTVLLSWSLVEGLALVDNTVNYIHVNYNAGTPAVQTTTDRTTIELNREFTLARVYRSGTTLHILNSGVNLPNFFRKEHERLILVRGFERASGGEISGTGTRNIASTIGKFWLGLNSITTTAKDTSGADRFTSWYRAAVSGWTEVTDQAQIDNEYYDDGTGTLHELTANRYAVYWVFVHYDSDLHVIYGQDDYKLTEAENAVLPDSLPDQVLNFGTLAAKIIIQKNAASFKSVVSAYKVLFPVSAAPTQIHDADGDTTVDTETAADEDKVRVSTGGTERIVVDSTGLETKVPLKLTGGQIAFPATQIPSANVNTLDDYQEGIWTPNVSGDATYHQQIGQYTKVGRLVTISGYMHINVIGTGGTSNIFGLPFTCNATLNGGLFVTFFIGLTKSVVFIGGIVDKNTTKTTFTHLTAAASSVSAGGLFGNGTWINFIAVYMV